MILEHVDNGQMHRYANGNNRGRQHILPYHAQTKMAARAQDRAHGRFIPPCTLETTTFSVCPGVTVTKDMILEHVDTSKCTDTPTVTIGAGNTYTVSCYRR